MAPRNADQGEFRVMHEHRPSLRQNTASSLAARSPSSSHGFGDVSGARNYDLSPDGKRFLVIKQDAADQASARQMTVVLNWLEELKRL